MEISGDPMTDLDDGQEGTDKKSIGIGKNEEIENGCLFYKTWGNGF